MRTRLVLSLLLGSLCLQAGAQNSGSSWAGEWGSFRAGSRGPVPQPEGRALTLSDCSGQRCSLSLLVQDNAGHGSAEGFAELVSPTEAVAHLIAQKQEHCTLRLTLDPQQPDVIVGAGTGDCSYFLTPGASFLQTFPLHTREIYVAAYVAGCFVATAPASLALCTDKALVEQHDRWQTLLYKVEEVAPSSHVSEVEREHAAETTLAGECNGAAQAKECLKVAFDRSSAELKARQTAWLDSVTTPGDPGEARKAAVTLEGTYRHSFPNSDIQGDNFLSTDKMEIELLPDNSIHYDVYLEFYNGHECSIEGTARFRRAGFFVDQQKTGQPDFPLCVFEIRPTGDAVQLADPTGACKMTTCGMRGGYNGAHFSFKDRH